MSNAVSPNFEVCYKNGMRRIVPGFDLFIGAPDGPACEYTINYNDMSEGLFVKVTSYVIDKNYDPHPDYGYKCQLEHKCRAMIISPKEIDEILYVKENDEITVVRIGSWLIPLFKIKAIYRTYIDEIGEMKVSVASVVNLITTAGDFIPDISKAKNKNEALSQMLGVPIEFLEWCKQIENSIESDENQSNSKEENDFDFYENKVEI